MSRASILLSLSAALVWNCAHESAPDARETPPSDQTSPALAAAPDDDAGDGLQCAVEALLQTRCVGCHGPDAKNGVPLVRPEDLQAPSAAHPGESIAARAIVRMRDTARPMPPRGEPIDEARIEELARWMDTGFAESVCP
jgi:mono/diheme cytochrome c family protein